MSVLDIGLLTGFTIDTNDLDLVRAYTNMKNTQDQTTNLHFKTYFICIKEPLCDYFLYTV